MLQVDSRKSFENVTRVWLPEVKKYGPPKASIIIVATKQDLRPRTSLSRNGSLGLNSDRPVPKERFVKFDQGLKLANEVGAYAFLECSALSENGVMDVFEQAIRAVLKTEKEEKSKNKESRSGSMGLIRSLLPGK